MLQNWRTRHQYCKIVNVDLRADQNRVIVTFADGTSINVSKTGSEEGTFKVDTVDTVTPSNNGNLASLLGALIQ